ncbi:putative transport protein HsrA [Pseudomonas aeruginosa]|nr:putative transport protein HsrA [Pseudomonas aeruginosa]
MSEPFQLTPRIARQLPWLVAVAFFMQALDGTILNTALPSMASSLNETRCACRRW